MLLYRSGKIHHCCVPFHGFGQATEQGKGVNICAIIGGLIGGKVGGLREGELNHHSHFVREMNILTRVIGVC